MHIHAVIAGGDDMPNNDHVTEGFVETHGLGICQGHYAAALVKEWHRWDAAHESENDPVDVFPADQLYVVFVFADGGVDLEHFELRSYQEAHSILLQASEDKMSTSQQALALLSCSMGQVTFLCTLLQHSAMSSNVNHPLTYAGV